MLFFNEILGGLLYVREKVNPERQIFPKSAFDGAKMTVIRAVSCNFVAKKVPEHARNNRETCS